MICARCNQEISFNQWLAENCSQPSWKSDLHTAGRDKVTTETNIRDVYQTMLTESAYSRTQP